MNKKVQVLRGKLCYKKLPKVSRVKSPKKAETEKTEKQSQKQRRAVK